LKKKIKDYWETRLPQTWYSAKTPFTRAWLDELRFKRYVVFYPFLEKEGEFRNHYDEKVLEVGCGIGTDIAEFGKYGADITAVDLTKEAVLNTLKMLNLYKIPCTRTDVRIADAEKLPFEKDTFDFIYSFGVLHHTPDTKAAVYEIKRVLKPGKTAVIFLYNRGLEYWRNVLKNYVFNGEFLRMTLQESLNLHSEVKGNCLLAKYYNRQEIEDLFKHFEILKLRRVRMGYVLDSFYNLDGSYKQGLSLLMVKLAAMLDIGSYLGDLWEIKVLK